MATEYEETERWEKARADESRNRQRDRFVTVIVAAFTGVAGVLGATLSHKDTNAYDEKPRCEFICLSQKDTKATEEQPRYEFRSFEKAMDEKTPVPMYRLDNKTGDVWYPRRLPQGGAEWILIRPSQSTAAPAQGPSKAPSQ